LAADEAQTKALMKKKVNAIAYETIEENRKLSCLNPMSEIAGRLSVQEGARFLEKPQGGRGILLGGVPRSEQRKDLLIWMIFSMGRLRRYTVRNRISIK
jgi:alanine dehydrogenase